MDAGEVVCPKKEFTASAPGRRVPTLCEDKVSAKGGMRKIKMEI